MEFLAELHPKVVHFPIALLITYALLELIGTIFNKEFFQKAAHLILLLGVIGCIFAVLTGNQAFAANKYWNDASTSLVGEHQTFANITIWYFVVLLVFKTFIVLKKKMNRKINYLILTLALIGCYFVYQASEHGGKLVTKYGIGTELNIEQDDLND